VSHAHLLLVRIYTAHFIAHVAASPWRNQPLPNLTRGGGRGAAQKKYTRIPPSTARSSSLLSSWLVSTHQRDVTKVEKFKSLFASPNLSLGEFCLLKVYLHISMVQLSCLVMMLIFKIQIEQETFLGNLSSSSYTFHRLVP